MCKKFCLLCEKQLSKKQDKCCNESFVVSMYSFREIIGRLPRGAAIATCASALTNDCETQQKD